MFEQALIESARKLADAKKQGLLQAFALIGGWAAARWGIIRATADVDYFVSYGDANRKELASFLGGRFRKGDVSDPLVSTISYDERAGGVATPIQLIEFPPAWERIALHQISKTKIGRQTLPIVDKKALVLLKLYAGGPVDLEDAKALMRMMSANVSAKRYIETKARSLRVSKRLAAITK